MITLSRLLTGGLVGFALILGVIGNPMWVGHAVGAAIAVLACFASVRSRWWAVVPYIVVVTLFFVEWYS
ncbi:hypothetical protein [Corynebacterium heidelbergense]|uniref:hypothetical protein n=1 Tax=Corynebacterium heidelbergense TaxID=2055947 RepID=UPI001EE7421C|nr:hypothetical protein [Corynebacterium heidelbergense]